MKLLLALTFLIGIHASGAGVVGRAVDAVLGRYETAPYTVVRQHMGFEERLYPARKWVSTTNEGSDHDTLKNGLFMRLFGYIGGNNVRNMSISMTTPVTSFKSPPTSSISSYTMAFFIPEEHQADAPAGGDDIVIENRPEMTVLTRRFPGYATNAVVTKEAQDLADLITAAGLGEDVDFDYYFTVGYDPPFKFFDRRNEIWYLKV